MLNFMELIIFYQEILQYNDLNEFKNFASLIDGGILFYSTSPLYLIDCFVKLIRQYTGKNLEFLLV